MRKLAVLMNLASPLLLIACGAAEVNTNATMLSSVESQFVTIGGHDTYLKINKNESTSLKAGSEKCGVKEGTTLLVTTPPSADANHTYVELRSSLPNCELKAGFLFTKDIEKSGTSTFQLEGDSAADAKRSGKTPLAPLGERRVCKAPNGLNLRSEPNTSSSVVDLIPMDDRLLLLGEAANGFVKVRVKNNKTLLGWVNADYVCYLLSSEDPSRGQSQYDSNYAYSLRNFTIENTDGRTWGLGRCYEFVWNSLRLVLGEEIEALPVPARSAYQFGDWIDKNPELARTKLKLERRNVTRRSAPVGAIFVWDPGQAGYNYTHGHIEVKIDDATACSDGCWAIKTWGAEPRIYVPIK